MGLFRRVGRMVKPLVNIPKWMGFDEMKYCANKIINSTKNSLKFQSKKDDKSQLSIDGSFDMHAMHFQLTEEDLQNKANSLFRISITLLICAILASVYSFYLLFSSSFMSFFTGFAVVFLMLSMSFRYHFLYLQIKKRKLGCTFLDWLNNFRNR